MKKLFISVFYLLCCLAARAQDCNCPVDVNNDNDGKPYKVYKFSNGKELGLCGYMTVELIDTTYTQFVLYNCGDNAAIKEWGKTKSCKPEKVKDELFIREMYGLPIGQSFSTIRVPFYIHKFSFRNGTLRDEAFYSKSLRKYSKPEIEQVFKEYNDLVKGNNGSILRVSKMLFWAYISGSKEAETYFKSIPDKFGPFESAIAEEMDDITAIFNDWKLKNIK
jgi:hypothetical protein